MKSIFVDTGGWGNLFVKSEPFHAEAVEIIHRILHQSGRVVTTNYILAELSALMIRPLRVSRQRRLTILKELRNSAWVKIVHIDADIDARSWVMLEQYADKDFSLVDAPALP